MGGPFFMPKNPRAISTISRMMKFALFSLFSLVLLFGCKHGAEAPDATAAKHLALPRWTFLAKASATVAAEQATVPKLAYVFPALRLNAQGQAIDQLAHRTLPDGTLSWYSPAPLGYELQAIAQRQLVKQGFTPISFDALTANTTDHAVTVFNLYYTQASASRDNPDAALESSWTTFCRITAATFPKDLNPNTKRDLMRQELVSLFNGKATGKSVSKHSVVYLLKHMGETRQWSDKINLL